jgi:molybdopterin biosynthesis enzyme MoaB
VTALEGRNKILRSNYDEPAEAMRIETLKYAPLAMISRGVSGIRSSTLIVNRPGAPKGVRESFEVIKPVLGHVIDLISGQTGHN